MRYKILITVLALFFLQVSVKAQLLRGQVSAAETGEVVPGALIVVAKTNLKVVSGLDGSFIIKGLSESEYAITISGVGYLPETVSVKVSYNTSPFLVKLKTAISELTAVTVTGRQNPSGDAAVRNMERLSDRVTNMVSAKAIELSPDLTVANVIQRISGITVERNSNGDAQYALLRGMDKRYNYTLVNGVKIPSPDNKNRFVPLDIFPAEMLERLEVNKSLTPDMEGDGVGGAINLVMKDAPESMQLSANIATGLNTLFTNRPFYSYGKSQIQNKSPFEALGPSYPAKSRDFNPGLLNIRETGLRPNIMGGLSCGDRFFNNKLGILLAGTYQNSLRGSNSTDFPYTTATSDASNLPVLTAAKTRTFSEEQLRSGAHAKLDYRFSQKHKLQLYAALMDFKTYQVRDERKTDLSVGFNPEGKSYNLSYDTRFRYTHQQIRNATLKGEHALVAERFFMDWSAVYSKATNEIPDNSSVHLTSTVRNGVENPKSVVVLGGAERRWEHNSDEDKAGYLNFNYKAGNISNPVILTAGAMYRNKERNNFFNEYAFRPLDESKPEADQKNLIQGIDWQQYSEIKFTVFNPLGSTGDPLNYDASEKISAAYLQGKARIANLEMVAGARLEHTRQGYFLAHPVAGLPNEGLQKYTDLLPGINLKWELAHHTNLRVAYYKALNRPSFFEIVPYRIINEEITEAGNPDLKHTIAHNADIRYELFPRAAEQLLVGAFYKKIINPIELGMVSQGQNTFYMPSNFGNATNYGLELDYTRYLHYFGIKLNYTYTNATITTSKLFYYNNPDAGATEKVLIKNVDQKRRLAGQAAHVANFTLLYKNENLGVNGQLSLAYTGDRLYAVSKFLDNDWWQSGFAQLDASAEKRFLKKYVVFLKATNLLNTPIKLYVKKQNPANTKAPGYETLGNSTMTRKDVYGQTLLVGLRFKF